MVEIQPKRLRRKRKRLWPSAERSRVCYLMLASYNIKTENKMKVIHSASIEVVVNYRMACLLRSIKKGVTIL
jgi:hypothetical protein